MCKLLVVGMIPQFKWKAIGGMLVADITAIGSLSLLVGHPIGWWSLLVGAVVGVVFSVLGIDTVAIREPEPKSPFWWKEPWR